MTGERLWLACDYSADPTWWESDGAMAELSELALGDELRAALERWADWFELTSETQTVGADGMLRYFINAAEEAAFEAEGLRLWRRARDQLAGRHEVGYASRLAARRLWDPNEPLAQRAVRLAGERSAGYCSLYERAEHARARTELQDLLGKLAVYSAADRQRVDLGVLPTGVLAAIIARQARLKKLSASDQIALERASWPIFEGHPMP